MTALLAIATLFGAVILFLVWKQEVPGWFAVTRGTLWGLCYGQLIVSLVWSSLSASMTSPSTPEQITAALKRATEAARDLTPYLERLLRHPQHRPERPWPRVYGSSPCPDRAGCGKDFPAGS